MEAATLRTAQESAGRLVGPGPLLRLQSDERLVTMIRRGNPNAFEALVGRYQSRLLAFCNRMLGNRQDAEDVLQEVFASAYTAMLADEREINVKPWLYKIARNRSLNHMRRQRPVGVDSMDIHVADHGITTAERVHRQEEFRDLIADIALLPESQRAALMLREVEGLSYDQIAETMETTVPSVKSLLVRARVALAELTEARGLTCDDVRLELGEVAEGTLRKLTPPVRRHLKSCDRCKEFKAHLTSTDRALAAISPIGLLAAVKHLIGSQLGIGSGSAAVGGSTVGATSSISASLGAGVASVATKAVAGVAAAALVTAGAVEVRQGTVTGHDAAPATSTIASTPANPPAGDQQTNRPKATAKAPLAVVATAAAMPATTADATAAMPADAAPAQPATVDTPAGGDSANGPAVVIEDETIDVSGSGSTGNSQADASATDASAPGAAGQVGSQDQPPVPPSGGGADQPSAVVTPAAGQ